MFRVIVVTKYAIRIVIDIVILTLFPETDNLLFLKFMRRLNFDLKKDVTVSIEIDKWP